MTTQKTTFATYVDRQVNFSNIEKHLEIKKRLTF